MILKVDWMMLDNYGRTGLGEVGLLCQPNPCKKTYFLVFAILWYAILYFHGDIDHFGEEEWKPCITGIHTFTTAFLFSVETQHTTGYGFYELTEQCGSGVFLFCAQSIVGVILEGVMVGLVLIKTMRAKKRRETIMFSKNAVIGMRDGALCFMFRVADMRKAHLVEAHVRAQLIRKRKTKEGEIIPEAKEEIEVGGEGEKDNRVLIFWPTTILHEIDEESPLKNISEGDLQEGNDDLLEIIVVLEGIVESTGCTVQARSSYLPSEILWAHQFQNLKFGKTQDGKRTVDFSTFHETQLLSIDV
ncbi:ATP-sensitive inward rectifier potassium channel 12 [Orchesella cincta]|uniref:ATP-sensitive inward rectifier potassium channel 12 n=1 Tax=Orchesella cincta TaxID=48709 RepID=A0A1D2MD44_ORCCI|nr:ATP-sensitive inward rectifier potassium channel 12 [Orchesella cincta]